MVDVRREFLSPKEVEFLEGKFDDMYYQYRANLRRRIRMKVDSLQEQLELVLGNERLDLKAEEYDWTRIVEVVQKFRDELK